MKKQILVVDDESASRFITKTYLEEKYIVLEANSKKTCMEVLNNNHIDLIVLDLMMPDVKEFELLELIKSSFKHIPVIMFTVANNVQKSVQAIKLGASDYIIKEDIEALLLHRINKIFYINDCTLKARGYKVELKTRLDNIFIPKSKTYQYLFDRALKAARKKLNVLIEGETGTGKDVLARYIHKNLGISNPMITLNCGAIPENLLEAELFGYEEGSFTGANKKRLGKIELASESILFLDEIGNMSLSLQHKILRVIENKHFMRIGGQREINVDFILIAATNKELKNAIKQGQFREDLYYRLNQVNIQLPPLRNQLEIIPQFVNYFVTHFNNMYKQNFSIDHNQMQSFLHNTWKGNMRELKNEIQTLIAMGENSEPEYPTKDVFFKDKLFIYEKNLIQEAIIKCKHNISETARYLNIKRTTLLNRLEKLKINFDSE